MNECMNDSTNQSINQAQNRSLAFDTVANTNLETEIHTGETDHAGTLVPIQEVPTQCTIHTRCAETFVRIELTIDTTVSRKAHAFVLVDAILAHCSILASVALTSVPRCVGKKKQIKSILLTII